MKKKNFNYKSSIKFVLVLKFYTNNKMVNICMISENNYAVVELY